MTMLLVLLTKTAELFVNQEKGTIAFYLPLLSQEL
jgi:hypothetical protein